uniref:Uncharacterized protein n=1 Tax=uncultured marine virus TaxID=186617 RepID=A0A0F7L372_9VIRU|nr:hypothetical protein [uncultured marine virus]
MGCSYDNPIPKNEMRGYYMFVVVSIYLLIMLSPEPHNSRDACHQVLRGCRREYII